MVTDRAGKDMTAAPYPPVWAVTGLGLKRGASVQIWVICAADGCQLAAIRAELADLRVKARSSWLAGLPADHF
jgi:hypothetical protein